jgi:hypothetical protein
MSDRTCGSCKMCCYLLPTPQLDLPANTHCRHECSKGCAIYPTRPSACRMFACRWLLGDDVGLRPDRAGYVVDCMPDLVTAVDATGREERHPVYQIWIDPERPDAHRAPALRRWLEAEGKRVGMYAIVRYGTERGAALIPPSLTGAGWIFKESGMHKGPANPPASVIRELQSLGIGIEFTIGEDIGHG